MKPLAPAPAGTIVGVGWRQGGPGPRIAPPSATAGSCLCPVRRPRGDHTPNPYRAVGAGRSCSSHRLANVPRVYFGLAGEPVEQAALLSRWPRLSGGRRRGGIARNRRTAGEELIDVGAYEISHRHTAFRGEPVQGRRFLIVECQPKIG